jgi:hypothetical protein
MDETVIRGTEKSLEQEVILALRFVHLHQTITLPPRCDIGAIKDAK